MRLTRICQLGATLSPGSCLRLDAAASVHVLRVLRHRPGDHLRIFDGQGHEAEGCITQAGSSCTVLLGQRVQPRPESPLRLELAQVLPRGERMDFTLQKATELGISHVHPLLSARCGVRLDDVQRRARREHGFQGIVIAACEQCGRARVPALSPIRTFAQFLTEETGATLLLLDPLASQRLREVRLPPEGRTIVIAGPEGGLTPQELEQARQAGATGLSLGPRILRTETAALAALAALGAMHGDL